MDRQSSDRTASMASELMRRGSPLDDDALLDQIVRNVVDAVSTGTPEMARNAIREPLAQYMNAAKSLAGSVVSQGDGPE